MSAHLLPAFAALLLLAGCPRGRPPVMGLDAPAPDGRPADLGSERGARRALRGDIERRLHVLDAGGDSDDPTRRGARERLQLGHALLEDLDAIDGGAGRDAERAALRLYADHLRRVVAEERTDFAPDGPTLPDGGPWSRARASHAAGDIDAALVDGLTALRELTDAGVDSASLRARLGEWAVAAGDSALAIDLFSSAIQAGDAEHSWAREAAIQVRRTRALALGPDAVALAEADALADLGELAQSVQRIEALLATGEDPEVLADAAALHAIVMADAVDTAAESFARAAAILEGPGPYGDVAGLLAVRDRLPPGTWDSAERLRLEGWLRARTGDADATQVEARRQELDAILGDARDLVIAGDVRRALLAYEKLDGSELQSVARREARAASETLVRAERERAGKAFVAARKQPAGAARVAALNEVRGILEGLLAEFPGSSYADRLRANLDAVLAELAAAR